MKASDADVRFDELHTRVIRQYDGRETISERMTRLEHSVGSKSDADDIRNLQNQIDALKNGQSNEEKPPWWRQDSTAAGMWANFAMQSARGASQAVDGSVSALCIAASGVAISTGILSLTGFAFENTFFGTRTRANAADLKISQMSKDIDALKQGTNIVAKKTDVTEKSDNVLINQLGSLATETFAIEIKK